MDVTIPLDADLAAFVEGQIESGRFSSRGDVILEALYLFRSIDLDGAYTTDELQAAWRAGVDSGDAGGIDFAELKREARAGLHR